MAKKQKTKWKDRDASWKTWFIVGSFQGFLLLIVAIAFLVHYLNK